MRMSRLRVASLRATRHTMAPGTVTSDSISGLGSSEAMSASESASGARKTTSHFCVASLAHSAGSADTSVRISSTSRSTTRTGKPKRSSIARSKRPASPLRCSPVEKTTLPELM
jgi:hypothetical protein